VRIEDLGLYNIFMILDFFFVDFCVLLFCWVLKIHYINILKFLIHFKISKLEFIVYFKDMVNGQNQNLTINLNSIYMYQSIFKK